MDLTYLIGYRQALEAKIADEYPQTIDSKSLNAPIHYLMNLGGKRIRPTLTLISCELFGGKKENALHTALAIEVFHNFTLMHDDIMDKAPIRRGMLTVHKKWDENQAILSGDTMLVHAYQHLLKDKPDAILNILERFNQTAIEVCEGQQLDMQFEKRNDVTVDEYIEMIRLKTAVLLGAALELGAQIASASKDNLERIYDFGQLLGIAFQLKDDLLDVFGEQDKIGKQVAGDILSNKKTYLYLKAMELADENQKKDLTHYYSSTDFEDSDKIVAVKEIFSTLNIMEITEQEVKHFHSEALKALDAIDADEEKKKALYLIAEQLFVRQY